jgi:hypothetical protein
VGSPNGTEAPEPRNTKFSVILTITYTVIYKLISMEMQGITKLNATG